MIPAQIQTIGVLVGGPPDVSKESLRSGQHVAQSLQSQGLAASIIDAADSDLVAKLRSLDLVFVSTLGEMGEDGTIQGLLKFLQIPHTGSGMLGSALCSNKLLTKQIYKYHGIPTPKYRAVHLHRDLPEQLKGMKGMLSRFSFPVVVKPLSGSLGAKTVFVLRYSDLEPTLKSLTSEVSQVLVEEFVSSNTFIAHVLDIDDELKPLPVIEIDTENQLYDSVRRRDPQSYTVMLPGRLPAALEREAQHLAVSAHMALRCTGVSRTDVFADPFGKLFVTETDTIFDFSKEGLLFRAALSAGVSYDGMISAMIDSPTLHGRG